MQKIINEDINAAGELFSEALKFKPDYHFSFKFTKKQLKDRIVEHDTLKWASMWATKLAKSSSEIPFDIVSEQVQKAYPRNSKEMNALKKHLKQTTGLTMDQIEKGWKKIPKEKVSEPEKTFNTIPTGVDVKEIEVARKDIKKAVSLLNNSMNAMSTLPSGEEIILSGSTKVIENLLKGIEFKLDYEWKQ